MMARVPFALVVSGRVRKESTISRALNEEIMNEINASGKAYLSHTKLNDKFVLRLRSEVIRVEERHLAKVWEILNVSFV
jgi:aromatic-L-amino-acid decarboxylase